MTLGTTIEIVVELQDILRVIENGEKFYWSILYLFASGNLGEGKSIPLFEEKINKSEKGFYINWEELNCLSKKFFQVIDIIIIGCKNVGLLKRYETDEEMYNNCEIVIKMIDSYYWIIHSKNEDLISKIEIKFSKITKTELSTGQKIFEVK